MVPSKANLELTPITVWVLTVMFHDSYDYRNEIESVQIFGAKPTADELEQLGVPGDYCNAVWHGEGNPEKDGRWWYLVSKDIEVPLP